MVLMACKKSRSFVTPPQCAGGSHCFVQLGKMMEHLASLGSFAKNMMNVFDVI